MHIILFHIISMVLFTVPVMIAILIALVACFLMLEPESLSKSSL